MPMSVCLHACLSVVVPTSARRWLRREVWRASQTVTDHALNTTQHFFISRTSKCPAEVRLLPAARPPAHFSPDTARPRCCSLCLTFIAHFLTSCCAAALLRYCSLSLTASPSPMCSVWQRRLPWQPPCGSGGWAADCCHGQLPPRHAWIPRIG